MSVEVVPVAPVVARLKAVAPVFVWTLAVLAVVDARAFVALVSAVFEIAVVSGPVQIVPGREKQAVAVDLESQD